MDDERPWNPPPYTYVPGRAPHPLRDPAGHSYRRPEEEVDPPDAEAPASCPSFLRGVDLFNHGFYWEAHEAWEAVWIAAGRTTSLARFLQGLIKLAAAGVKVREGRREGVARHAKRAAELFTAAVEAFEGRVLGLDPGELAAAAVEIAAAPPNCEWADAEPVVVFGLVLVPVTEPPRT